MPSLTANNRGSNAVVIGAGIIGLTSALRLAQTGYLVTIIEQENTPCQVTSKANAGQLLYDRIGAMGSPGFLRGLPKTLRDRDQGVHISGLANPAKWPWAGAFLRQCTTGAWQRNTAALLEIAKRSRAAMDEVCNQYQIDFDWQKPGKLVLHRSQGALSSASAVAGFQAGFGGRHQVLSAKECIAQEPALKDIAKEFAGGIYLPDAEVGDCQKFGAGLASILTDKYGVKIIYGVEAVGFEREGTMISALRTRHDHIAGEIFVVATGGAASKLLHAKFPGKKPIIGIKGISLTFPAGPQAPDLSVTDAGGKFVIMRLGDQVRIAGYAMFSDDLNIPPEMVRRLIEKARKLMPEAAMYDATPDIWVGARPTTPDDLPMIGQADAANLFVNAGHGSLGWTLAMGSAEILVEKILVRQR